MVDQMSTPVTEFNINKGIPVQPGVRNMSLSEPCPQEVRRLLFKLIIDLMHLMNSEADRLSREKGANCDIDTILIQMAMCIGRMEGNPPDISALAAMTGLSRQAINRRIRELESNGFIDVKRHGRRAVPLPARSDFKIRDEFVGDLIATIEKACNAVRATKA